MSFKKYRDEDDLVRGDTNQGVEGGNNPLTTTKQFYHSQQNIDTDRLKTWYQKAFELFKR